MELNEYREGCAAMRAAVIGGGIGGTTAALALAAIGVQVEVHEARARQVEESGWVTLGPAAMTGLDQVGVAEEIHGAGFPVMKVCSVDLLSGKSVEFSRHEPTHHYPSTHVWRRDLLAILRKRLDRSRVTCYYGRIVTAVDLDADLIVGADGARSRTRRHIGNPTDPRYTGEIIRYGHHQRPAPGLPPGVLHFWRHQAGVVGYVGDERDGSFWFSRYASANPAANIDLQTMIAPLRDTPIAPLLDTSRLGPPVALYDLDPGGSWHSGHTVIIGDAAHAVSPAAGRGATSTIEDAIILAKHLHRHNFLVPEALDSFTASRRPVAQATYHPKTGQRAVAATADELDLTPHASPAPPSPSG